MVVLIPGNWSQLHEELWDRPAEVVTAPGRTWSLGEVICIVRMGNSMCWTAHSLHRHIPKSYKHKSQGSLFHPFNIPCENHTLSNTGQNVISQDYFFSGIFFQDCFWRIFFFFLIDHAKNNPSGKDVVWLSEKAAPSPSKFCYQCLWGTNQHRGLLLAFDHLTFVKPPKTLSKVW